MKEEILKNVPEVPIIFNKIAYFFNVFITKNLVLRMHPSFRFF